MNKEKTIAAVHAAFTKLQIAICDVSTVEHKTTLPHAFRSVLGSIITDLESAAARLENATRNPSCSVSVHRDADARGVVGFAVDPVARWTIS